MKAIWLTKNSTIWYLATLGVLVLVILGLIVLIRSVRTSRNRRSMLLAGFNFLAGVALLVVLMDCARYAYLPEQDLRYRAYQITLFELPWSVYAGLEAASALLLALLIRKDHLYRRSHLTPDAIRETMNLLPEGICISASDGTVLLSNLQMNALCRSLTRGTLSDAARFREKIDTAREQNHEETLVRTPEGKCWRFSQGHLTENGEEYGRIIAADVTEQYRATEELREKNERLQNVQRRMKAVSDLSGDMFVAQEETDARAALHNQLGQVLLMGRHYLDHPDNTDAERVYFTTVQMNRFLLREAEQPAPEAEDELQLAFFAARSIGVAVKMTGDPPQEAGRRELLAAAIRECSVNTAKHAEGDALFVEIAGDTFRFTNNGKPPKGPIVESGGLLALRQKTEAAGGMMGTAFRPSFALTIRLPF